MKIKDLFIFQMAIIVLILCVKINFQYISKQVTLAVSDWKTDS